MDELKPGMKTLHGQFARVVKGVDLRSTAGNCAWVQTPQLTCDVREFRYLFIVVHSLSLVIVNPIGVYVFGLYSRSCGSTRNPRSRNPLSQDQESLDYEFP